MKIKPKVVELRPGKSRNFRDYETLAERKERLAGLVGYLRDIATHIELEEYEIDPHGVVVVLVGQDTPELTWKGIKTWDEAREVAMTIQDYIHNRQYGSKTNSVAWSRKNKKERDLELQLYIDEHPWVCEAKRCGRRFKSERGASVHEKHCWQLRNERQQAQKS